MDNMQQKRKGNYKRKWNTDNIKQFIADNNIEVELLSEYADMYTKMIFKCKCGNLYETNLHEFNNKKFPKRQCNECGRKKPNDTNKITCDTIRNYLKNNNYTCELLSNEYTDCDSKLEFKCECGDIFYASWSNIKSMTGLCKKCAMTPITHNDYMVRISKYLDRFDVITKYNGSDKNISIKCKKCGFVINQRAKHTYERGIYCPCCDGTKGEQYISNYLLVNNIDFIPQYKFEDCKYINPLPFDFYLPKYNLCIEYQGQQHYYAVDFFGGEDKFKEQVKRDKIKKDYCNNNNINLLEISYENFNNIDDVLNSIFIDKGVV